MSAAVFEYFATSSIAIVRPRIPAPDAAVLLRDDQAEQAGVAEELEEILRVLLRAVDLTGPRLRRAPARACAPSPAAPPSLQEGRNPPAETTGRLRREALPRRAEAVYEALRRCRSMRRRSRSVMPPQTPIFSRRVSAWSRQTSRTGQSRADLLRLEGVVFLGRIEDLRVDAFAAGPFTPTHCYQAGPP